MSKNTTYFSNKINNKNGYHKALIFHGIRNIVVAFLLIFSLTQIYACGKKQYVQVFTYEDNDDGTVRITGLTDKGKSDSKLVIPEQIDGKDVTVIGAECFRADASVTSVTVGKNVIQISENAFLNCVNLENITFEGTVETIGTNAFTNTKWENNILSDNNEVIVCNILVKVKEAKDTYRVPDSVVTIGSGVFYNNKDIKEVILPDSVETIGTYAFYGCTSLEKINIPGNIKNIDYCAFADCGLKNVVVPKSVEYVGNDAFLNVENVVYK